MNPEILNQLHDVQMPVAPSWWPPSLRALSVIIVFALFLFVSIAVYILGRKKRRIKKQVLEELFSINDTFICNGDDKLMQTQINGLVRRLLFLKNDVGRISSTPLCELTYELNRAFPRSKNLELFVELLTRDRFKKTSRVDTKTLMKLAVEHFKKCRV